MKLIITGATGHLGRHILELLLKVEPAQNIVASLRRRKPAKHGAISGWK